MSESESYTDYDESTCIILKRKEIGVLTALTNEERLYCLKTINNELIIPH